MRFLLRPLLCNVLLACCLSACSGPANRVREHAAAFARIAPADQQLVRHGRIRPGMSREAVAIAWGEPDAKVSGGDGKSGTETWVYRQRVTLLAPINSYDAYGPYHGLGDDWARRGFLPAYTYGGTGYEGTLRYQPHVRSLDSVRIAEFAGGKVDRFKSANGTWTASTPVTKSIAQHHPSPSHPHVAVHRGSQHGGKTHLSHGNAHGHGAHHLTVHRHSHSHGKGGFRTGGSS